MIKYKILIVNALMFSAILGFIFLKFDSYNLTIVAASESQIINNQILIEGYSFTPDSFNLGFSGSPESRIVKYNNQQNIIYLTDIHIVKDQIAFTIQYNKMNHVGDIFEEFEAHFYGYIRKGNRDEYAFVIEVENREYTFNILLFEINLNPKNSNILLHSSTKNNLNYMPHLKLYVQLENNDLILFETELPEIFNHINKNYIKYLDNVNDLFWNHSFALFYETVDKNYDSSGNHFEDTKIIINLDELINYFDLNVNFGTTDDTYLKKYIFNYLEKYYNEIITEYNINMYNIPFTEILPFGQGYWTMVTGGWRNVSTVTGNQIHQDSVRAMYWWRVTNVTTQYSGRFGIWVEMEQRTTTSNINGGGSSTVLNRGNLYLRDVRLSIGSSSVGSRIGRAEVLGRVQRHNGVTLANGVNTTIGLFTRTLPATAQTGLWAIQNISNSAVATNIRIGPDNQNYFHNTQAVQTRTPNYRLSLAGPSTANGLSNGHFLHLSATPVRRPGRPNESRIGTMIVSANVSSAIAPAFRHESPIEFTHNFTYHLR